MNIPARPDLSNRQLVALLRHCHLNAPPAKSRRRPFLSWSIAVEDHEPATKGIADALQSFGGVPVYKNNVRAYVRVAGRDRNAAIMYWARKVIEHERLTATGRKHRELSDDIARIDRYRKLWTGELSPSEFKQREPQRSRHRTPRARNHTAKFHQFPSLDEYKAYLKANGGTDPYLTSSDIPGEAVSRPPQTNSVRT